MTPEIAMLMCHFPAHLHPVSRMFLDHFVAGEMSTGQFLRFFSLPNSDYIALAQCFVSTITGTG